MKVYIVHSINWADVTKSEIGVFATRSGARSELLRIRSMVAINDDFHIVESRPDYLEYCDTLDDCCYSTLIVEHEVIGTMPNGQAGDFVDEDKE